MELFVHILSKKSGKDALDESREELEENLPTEDNTLN